MISTMFACLKKTSHKEVKVEQLKATETCKTLKKRVRFVDSEPTILGEENNKDQFEKRRCISNELEENEGIRVKIRLTKEQATQLLSKCNGSALEFNDLAHELLSIPGNRVSIVQKLTTF